MGTPLLLQASTSSSSLKLFFCFSVQPAQPTNSQNVFQVTRQGGCFQHHGGHPQEDAADEEGEGRVSGQSRTSRGENEVCEKMMKKKKKKKKRKKKRDFPRQQKDGNDYVIINNTFLQKFDNKTTPPTSLTSSIMQFQYISIFSIC